MPVLHLVAGPNGAGKSSYVRDVLGPATHLPFINADEIAAARWPGSQLEHAYEAARIAESERRNRLADGTSFISETVFSHPSKVQLVSDAVTSGYLVQLHVIIVPLVLSRQRVVERVRRGGHDVPSQKIDSRYARLWTYLGDAIRLADRTVVLDNSSARRPFRACASYALGHLEGMPTWPSWTPPEIRAGLGIDGG